MGNKLLLSVSSFWDLTNAVLERSGRPTIPSYKEDPTQNIISILPTDRVLQILAGPGAGKTEVLVWRVLYDILVIGTEPQRILLTTFTRKAAEELTVRLAARADDLVQIAQSRKISIRDPKTHDVRIGTIHSLCDQLLSEHVENYSAMDIRLLDNLEAGLHLRRFWWKRTSDGRKPADIVNDIILKYPAINTLLGNNIGKPDRIDLLQSMLSHQTETWMPRSSRGKVKNGLEKTLKYSGLTNEMEMLRAAWVKYLLEKPIALDFTSIQAEFLDCQEEMADAVDHVFVDEFQDTNPIQYSIHLGWLLNKRRAPELPPVRLTIVGDDDQSIYRFRGTDVGCFIGLEDECARLKMPFRKEIMRRNNRSSATIVEFSKMFREEAIPKACTLPKDILPVRSAGPAVRMITGAWQDICAQVAKEAQANGYGSYASPSVSMAALMFSSSEGNSAKPASDLRSALKSKGIQVDNPRNKSAGKIGSHAHMMAGLLSYFIDPITRPNNPTTGRPKQCAASLQNDMGGLAHVAEPSWKPAADHLTIQSALIQAWCGKNNFGLTVASSDNDFNAALAYLNKMRSDISKACLLARKGKGPSPRLTLAGLVARMLTLPLFRRSGYTIDMFRQALFTQIAESAIAASRGSGFSIDDPISCEIDTSGKIAWDSRVWDFIGAVGQMIYGSGVDDPEVDAFQENAFRILTFHQSKGLEFDEVYISATGREIDITPVLVTALFSGNPVKLNYDAASKSVSTKDPAINRWAQADAAREIYVAITRAKNRLTLLHDPSHPDRFMRLSPHLESIFEGLPKKKLGALAVQEWRP